MFRLLLLYLSLTLLLSAEMLTRTKILMGTFTTISVDEKDAHFVEHGFKIIKDVELSLSTYNKNSPIFKLNRDKKAKLNNYAYEAFEQSKAYYKRSDGYFDITVGSITKDLYRFGDEERVASIKELEAAEVDLSKVNFSESYVSLEEGVKVDFGGMGKGFGVDKVAAYFRANGIKAKIAMSGDIRCLDICNIDIQDPFSDGAIASFRTKKEDLGITTSGNYNRYVLSEKNNHLINPKSKKSQTKFVSITLVGELSSSELDAYATASSVMPVKKAYAFLDSLGVDYIVLQSDGELKKKIGKYITQK